MKKTMEKKSLKHYLQEQDLIIENRQEQLEKIFGLNVESENMAKHLIIIPLQVFGNVYKLTELLGANMVKYPLALVNYLSQKDSNTNSPNAVNEDPKVKKYWDPREWEWSDDPEVVYKKPIKRHWDKNLKRFIEE